jgi:hypothetical protein
MIQAAVSFSAFVPRPSRSPEYSCGKRNPFYPIRAASFVSVSCTHLKNVSNNLKNPVKILLWIINYICVVQLGVYHCSDSPLFRRPIIPTTHYSDNPLLRRPIFPTMQNRTQSTNPWFNQVYPTGWFVGQANLDGPRQNVLERKRSFYPKLYIPAQGNYDRPTWYGES